MSRRPPHPPRLGKWRDSEYECNIRVPETRLLATILSGKIDTSPNQTLCALTRRP